MKNLDFLMKNLDFLLKNLDFLLKNLHFCLKTQAKQKATESVTYFVLEHQPQKWHRPLDRYRGSYEVQRFQYQIHRFGPILD